jgi:isoleucyl-tRNA synthetase
VSGDLDLKKTVFLPHTSFPMRGDLPRKEPAFLDFWFSKQLSQKQKKSGSKVPVFLLHDGPPYANGHLHIGHALNKIFKDAVNRLHFMRGEAVSFIPGWDCHGLPIEAKVEENYRKEGFSKKEVDPLSFRKACRSFASQWIKVQAEEFKRMGIAGDFDAPYTTMSPLEETGIVKAFLEIFMRGDVYRGVKPVMWSVVEETALAEAEVEYKEIESSAIDVIFPILSSENPALSGVSCVIWTTTPWTLPANRAIAYAPELTYVVLEALSLKEGSFVKQGSCFLIAQDLVLAFCGRSGIENHEILHRLKGQDLEGVIAAHPFRGDGYDFPVPLLPGDHVTADTGTGLVHTAPSHGVEDFLVGQTFGLEIPETVGPSGLFMPFVPLFGGAHVYKVTPQMIEALKSREALLSHGKILHSYPHSWRSKTPLIYRATAQWFMPMDGENQIRSKSLEEIEKVRWIPDTGKNRLQSMVAGRPDWCLSRQRVWGVPITLFLSRTTGEPLRDPRVNQRILDIMTKEGTDAWWDLPVEAFLGDLYPPEAYEKATDILDVWFDSGVTHEFVLKQRDLPYPADLYLEGSDQHRGWFQTSLLTAVALGKEAPYRAVLTHGFVLDGAGRKMSKSQGNVVTPQEIIGSKGADILRLWALSSDFEGDVRISPELIKHVEDVYRRFRNTFRYLLGGLSDFDAAFQVSYEDLPPLERWMLSRLWRLQEHLGEVVKSYRFQGLIQEIHAFCTTDLSAFYFDVRKDVLYCDALNATSRRAMQTVMREVLFTLVRALAPVLVFTCEEVWQTMREELKAVFPHLEESVHLSQNPSQENLPFRHDQALEEHFDVLRSIRQVVTGALEVARAEKKIGSSLGSCPVVYVPPSLRTCVSSGVLEELCLTSGLVLFFETPPSQSFQVEEVRSVGVVVNHAQGEKCERCWKVLPEVQASLCQRCAKVLKS